MTNDLVGVIEARKQLTGNIKEGGSSGTSNYEVLSNKPRINDVELRGNKTFNELGLIECSNQDIEDMFRL